MSAHAIGELTARHQARERALAISRQVIRNSANAIRAVHRNDFEEARRLVGEASASLSETVSIRTDNPEIYYAGFLSDARKEFTEANITLAVISGADIPDAETLGIDPPAYLNGMAEVIGELRRYILDALRRDDTTRCEELMELMDEIYGILVTVDFPEAVTGGLRHSTDAMRGVLERTRGDLTISLQQRRLEQRLAELEG
ncbi:MAG: haloacid dehalogenase [Chloroflexi bacterium]|nr:haloacid dehalogenase [Chloroflexota bacterium]MYD49634.1 haloacid dehalogenase [Chloroflexota bacterium]